MPKLTIDQRTKGKAVGALLKLYKSEPNFAKELNEIRVQHLPVFERWLEAGLQNWIQMENTLSRDEMMNVKDFFLVSQTQISDEIFTKIQSLALFQATGLNDEMETYIGDLKNLAQNWKLNAPWAGVVLLFNQILECVPEDARSMEIPIEMILPLLPAAPLQPLKLDINSYELLFSGRKKIQDRLRETIEEYENNLKSVGWQELPTSVEKHAGWWFKHYVHEKTYVELENEEAEDGAGRESIKRAVWKFSKLLNIKVR